MGSRNMSGFNLFEWDIGPGKAPMHSRANQEGFNHKPVHQANRLKSLGSTLLAMPFPLHATR